MYVSPLLTADVAQARRADLLSGAQRRRLALDVRAARRPNGPRRVVAGSLLAVARRVDPSLVTTSSFPAVHTG